MEPLVRKKAKDDLKKRIGGVVAVVSFDTKSKKGKWESRVENFWHKNRDFHQISQPQKDELAAWNATTYGMKSKESYFYKLNKIKKTDHDKCGHSIKSGGGKGNMITKRYKSDVSSVVKANISNIKKDKELSYELYDKLFTLISTCIWIQGTEADPSVRADTTITQG